ncbi:MAG: hypothetical protein Q8N23_36375 [Archangium sp.]|nr:hypothetical protein [Archangium sp.]MDP3572451.1 hypothetical protein [Archangium sp.]
MHVRIWGWLCLSLVLAACPPKPLGECGSYFCTPEERCEAKTLLCVEDLAPVIVVTPRSGVVSTPTFELTGRITDDARVTAATWQLGTGAATPITLEPDGGFGFAIAVEAPLLDSQDAVVTLKAKDQRIEVSKDVAVKIDRVGPAFRVVRPLAGSLIGTATFELAVETTDGSGALSTLRINQASVPAPQSGAEIVETIAVPPTANGTPLEFELLATDAAGNQTRDVVQFIGDRVAPEVAFVTPTLNQYVITERFNAVVAVVEPSAIASAVFQFGGTTVMGAEVSPGRWSAELTTAIVEQDQLISVDVTDAAGNTTTVQTTVKVDRIQPTLSVTSPASASIHRVAIPLTVTTSQGTSQVGASLEGQQVALTGGPTSWTGSIPVPQRDFSAAMVQVTALDLAGNSRVVTVPISVDTVAPVIAFTSPSAGQKFNAAQLSANPNVTVTWTVTDADAQAGTTSINGSAGTATMRQVATSATDNPATYPTTVVATDRAGNIGTASSSFSADRVIPTLVSWVPAANARNVDLAQAVITFSEPVFGALSTSPALLFAAQPAPSNDVWSNAHATYSVPLTSFFGQVVSASVAPLADGHGNPVAGGARQFHVTTTFQANTNLLIATGVKDFDASSDSDGVITVATDTLANGLSLYKDTRGSFTLLLTQPVGTSPAVTSWNVVTTGLQSSHRIGLSTFIPPAPASQRHTTSTYLDGVLQTSAAGAARRLVLSRPLLSNEPAAATDLFGFIEGAQYTRGAAASTLPNPAHRLAQSNDSWVAVEAGATSVRWSHYRCRQTLSGSYNCSGNGYQSTTSGATQHQTAMTPSGGCLAVMWSAGGTRYAVFHPLVACDVLCPVEELEANRPSSPIADDVRVASFGGNGENTLLFSSRLGATDLRLAKMTAGTCGAASTTLATLMLSASPKAHMPIRAGNKPAVLYITSTDELRLWVP